MFSNTLSFLSSRRVNDQVSHPYKTTGKIIVLDKYYKFKTLAKWTLFLVFIPPVLSQCD